MSDAWLSLKYYVKDRDVAALEAVLERCGALAVTCQAIDEVPIFDTLDSPLQRLWPNCEVAGLFTIDIDASAIQLQVAAAGIAYSEAHTETFADQPWHTSWMDQFQPLGFGHGLWVCPSWRTPPAEATTVITLDPGMAFGTGTHSTTGLCLEWLAQPGRVAAHSVIDYGCGSGILAIGAAKLGARAVVAVDIDRDALLVAGQNTARNGCADIVIAHPDELAAQPFDILVANLLLNPLLALRERFVELVRPGSAIALSGLLEEQAALVLAAYAPQFKMDPPQLRGGWALVTGTRRA